MFYLHTDHPSAGSGQALGSTSLTTDANGNEVTRQRYYPYGGARWTSDELPTDRRYTGQRHEAGLGLYDYNARFYDPALGRFISADTIVPQPGNPQDFNRYAYARNNPLRYTDPSGYYSEEEIMQAFGVSTWDKVLAHFLKDGMLEGRWGWLEVLHEAATGDTIHFFRQHSSDIEEAMFTGTFLDIEGKLYLSFEGNVALPLLPHEHAARMGNYYLLKHWVGPGAVISGIESDRIYYHTKFDASKFDWVGAAFDIAGISADALSGIGGRGVNAAEIAVKANRMGGALDVASLIRTGVVSIPEGLSEDEQFDLALDAAGLWIPVVPDFISLCANIRRATYRTP